MSQGLTLATKFNLATEELALVDMVEGTYHRRIARPEEFGRSLDPAIYAYVKDKIGWMIGAVSVRLGKETHVEEGVFCGELMQVIYAHMAKNQMTKLVDDMTERFRTGTTYSGYAALAIWARHLAESRDPPLIRWKAKYITINKAALDPFLHPAPPAPIP